MTIDKEKQKFQGCGRSFVQGHNDYAVCGHPNYGTDNWYCASCERNRSLALIEQLKAENEALRKDAERYRFVRKTWCPDWPSEKADAQIDAAMAKEKGQ